MRDLLYRLRALFRRGAVEAELEEELRFHLERQAEKYRASGLPAARAGRDALLALGGAEQVREACRDSWGVRWLLDLLQDARYGLRALGRSPAFTLAAVASLALGIGANTSIFTVIDAVLLRPLPYSEPGRLTMIWETIPKRRQFRNVVSPADFLDWQSQATAFERMAAIDGALGNLTGVSDPEEIRGQYVTAEFFPLLGVPPDLGRTFTEADSETPVIVLSHRFWERRFASDPNILGRTVEIDRKPLTIIGVMPAGFERLETAAEFWRPFHLDPHRDYRKRDGRYLAVVARLQPAVSLAAAQTQMTAISERLERDHPEFSKGYGARVSSLRDEVSGDYRTALYILLGAVGLVLLIACANVANLLLSRGMARGREFAIRTSIGASPGRLARQLLTEGLLLASAGGIAGALLSIAFHSALTRTAPASLARLADAGFDGRVLAFCALLSLASALLFGLVPAFAGARSGAAARLKQAGPGGASTPHSRRLPNLLVTAEFALCLVLLAGAGLLLRSFVNLISVDTGFRSDHLLTARVLLPGSYKAQQRVAFFAEATSRIQALRGVRSASAVTFMPFGGIRPGTGFEVENRPKPAAGEAPSTEVRAIQPRYFATMGIPLLRGRDFSWQDNNPDRPVFIINQSLASRYWSNEDPIGQRITVDMGAKPMPGEIVGIAADSRDQKLDGAAAPTVFYAHPGLPIGYMSFVVRTEGDPAAVARAIPQIVHGLDPNQPVVDIRTMDQVLSRSVAAQRFQMLLLALFAAIALVLATVGIYGVISYTVAQRTNEIGIRIALGASRGDVLRMVLSQGGAIVLRGLILGVAGALALTRTVSGLLFHVKPADPLTLGGVVLLLTIAALTALAAPAHRASRVDPLQALRLD
jgi:putative ABC transport system permease protein